MKIVGPQAAVLSNAEVLAHLNHIASRRRVQAGGQGAPPLKSANFETVVKELTTYLNPTGATASSNNPSAGTHTVIQTEGVPYPLPPYIQQDSAAISRIFKRLAPFKLTKAEVLMVLNLRPSEAVLLDLIVEECDGRLSAEDQEKIIGIVREELGGGAS